MGLEKFFSFNHIIINNSKLRQQLRMENTALEEQYQKIWEDNNVHLAPIKLIYQRPMKSTWHGGNELHRLVNRVHRVENQFHPFIDGIMEISLAPEPGWKMLVIDRYNRLSDPDEHVDTVLTQMNLFTNDDVIMCRVFLTILRGATLY